MEKETKEIVSILEDMKKIHDRALAESMEEDPKIIELKAEIDQMSVYAEAQKKLEDATDKFDREEIDACMLEVDRLVRQLKRKFCEDIFEVAKITLQEIADEERALEEFEEQVRECDSMTATRFARR